MQKSIRQRGLHSTRPHRQRRPHTPRTVQVEVAEASAAAAKCFGDDKLRSESSRALDELSTLPPPSSSDVEMSARNFQSSSSISGDEMTEKARKIRRLLEGRAEGDEFADEGGEGAGAHDDEGDE